MAKKKEEEIKPTIKKVAPKKVENGNQEFKDLLGSLKKINEDSFLLSESPYSKIENFIDTGHYLLNAQISGDIFGGIPEGRITVLAGESGVGKSFSCLNLARAAQKQGYNIIWFDSESALDIDTTNRFKIDPSRLMHIPTNLISDVTTYIANLADTLLEKQKSKKETPKILIIIDSLGNLSTDKETNDAKSGSDKADMTRPKEIRKLFRVATTKLGQLKIPVVLTNHVYASIGGYITQNTQSGGGGIIYNASTILMLSKAQLKEKTDGPVTGIIVTSKVKKSRLTKAGMDIKFFLSFYHGMNPFIGLEEYISWETCGIGPGKIIKNEYIPDEGGRTFAVQHLGKHIASKDLFTKEVFTKEVLEKLRPILKEKFEFNELEDYSSELEGLFNSTPETENED